MISHHSSPAPLSSAVRWQAVPIERIQAGDRARPVSSAHVQRLFASFQSLGGQLQLQPILLDSEMMLIDGAHRLEAAKRAGWASISALIIEGEFESSSRLEIEANLVRRSLGPADLEAAWRAHYEPSIRAEARRRRAAGLRQNARRHVIPNTDNDEKSSLLLEVAAERISVAKAAKAVTGLSLDTLDKIAEMRLLASSSSAPREIRAAAEAGLRDLSEPGSKVAPVYRRLRGMLYARETAASGEHSVAQRETAHYLQRAVDDSARLAEQLTGQFGDDLLQLVADSPPDRQLLRTLRNMLATALATTVSLECKLEPQPRAALRRHGAEVSRMLSRTSSTQLKPVVVEASHAAT